MTADPNNFVDYLLPRGVRKVLTGASAAGCLLGTFLAAARLLVRPLHSPRHTRPSPLSMRELVSTLHALRPTPRCCLAAASDGKRVAERPHGAGGERRCEEPGHQLR
jgi:hypothetical protein